MTNIVLLNNVDHGEMRVAADYRAAFGDAINQALVFPTEYEALQREYPIFFRKEGDGFRSIVLLGLDRDENLFLDDAGGWNACYIPAVQQRGPFSVGLRRDHREPMINIDLDHPRIMAEGGTPIFLPHGGNTRYLDQIAKLLGAIHEGLEASPPMFAAFAEAGLIEPVLVEIELDDAERYEVPDLYTIDAARLARLDGAVLERLHQAGFLRAAFLVQASLGNVNRLIDLKNRRRA